VLKTVKTVITKLHQLDDKSLEYSQILEKGETFVAECSRVMWNSVLEDPDIRFRVARDVFHDDTSTCLPSTFDNEKIRKVHRTLLNIPDERLVWPPYEEHDRETRTHRGRKRRKITTKKRRVVTLREYLDYSDKCLEDLKRWREEAQRKLDKQRSISHDKKFSSCGGFLVLGLVFNIVLYIAFYW
jgi:hypothetical protein